MKIDTIPADDAAELSKPHFQVMVPFFVQADTEAQAIAELAKAIPDKLIHDYAAYSEAWAATPWDMLG